MNCPAITLVVEPEAICGHSCHGECPDCGLTWLEMTVPATKLPLERHGIVRICSCGTFWREESCAQCVREQRDEMRGDVLRDRAKDEKAEAGCSHRYANHGAAGHVCIRCHQERAAEEAHR